MARRSKSSKDTENKEEKEIELESAESESPDESESTTEEPVIIEAVAEEIEPPESEEPESASEEVQASTPSPAPRQSSIPLFLGGLAAGAVGFLIAFLAQDVLFKDDGEDDAAALSDNKAAIETLAATIDETRDAIPSQEVFSDLRNSIGEVAGNQDELRSSLSQLAATSKNLELLQGRVADLETRFLEFVAESGNESASQAAEIDARLSAFRGELDGMIAEAEGRLAQIQSDSEAAEMAARKLAEESQMSAMISELRSAVESGAPFDGLLASFESPPAPLASHAGDGVPSLVTLQQEYPDFARRALATTQKVPEEASAGEKLTAFLKQRTNARSLTPQDGNSTDAVLSRAESSLAAGDLEATLTELSELPEDAYAAMSQWLSRAQSRSDALSAIDMLSTKLN